MTLLNPVDSSAMEFSPEESLKKTKAVAGKIGWLHTMSDEPGAKFDITIKDALGRIKYQKNNCGTETNQYGELVNLPTLIGEDLQIEVKNLKGAKKISLFLN